MNEVEKMYRNCGIENYRLENYSGFVPDGYIIIDDENKEGYVKEIVRDFNSEKQLELIKLLAKFENVLITYYHSDERYNINYRVSGWYDGSFSGYVEEAGNTFEEVLASVCNHLWQDLTDAEKAQIKEILE